MSQIIIYGSKYGTSMKYAEALSEKLGIPAVSYKEVRNINIYDEVIYIGGLYAGGVCGMAKTLKKWTLQDNRRLCIVTVGVSDPTEKKNIECIRGAIKMQLPEVVYEKAAIFHLRGGIDYSRLNKLHKMMMGMVYKKAKSVPEDKRDAETEAMIETYNQKVDFVDLLTLSPIIEYFKAK